MWRHRLLPYPLLSNATDDYPLSGFTCQVRKSVLSNGEFVDLALEYRLNCESLESLIGLRQADFAVQTACVRTYSRDLHMAGHNSLHFLKLPVDDYADDFTVTPYIVATEPIKGFATAEHNSEIRELKPEGFDLERGAILAVTDSVRIIIAETNPNSVIDLVANSSTPAGRYELDLTTDRIKLYVNPVDKLTLERFRSQRPEKPERAALVTALYLNVITQALHQLHEYPESAWAQSINLALERHSINTDPAGIRHSAPQYAQTILEAPLGRLLVSLTNVTDME